ncbi:unnamed protein product [Gemmataceae bacterium]|nr:unnamed protein product [Gemmataceae bacterium]VTU00069.1 unnamed protein product [Gemmataceae bacterium]
MGRVQAVIAVAALGLGTGCAGMNPWKSKPELAKSGDGLPSAPLSRTVQPELGGPVVQASAFSPVGGAVSTFAKVTGKTVTAAKVPAAEITILWRNKIDHLPDPTRNGAMGAGLAGQLFLFGPAMQFAPADGKLTVALYDESPRPQGTPPAEPQVWEFTKETLKGLKTPDERFGMSYALFLPWPSYRPDVTRVRIAARYESEGGNTLYPKETRVTLDTGTLADGGSWSNQSVVPSAGPQQGAGFNALGGPPPAAGSGPGLGVLTAPGTAPPASLPSGVVQPAPANYGSLAPVSAGPPAGPPPEAQNLPPIAITIPRGR